MVLWGNAGRGWRAELRRGCDGADERRRREAWTGRAAPRLAERTRWGWHHWPAGSGRA